MSFSFATPRASRRPGLTPLIDVVFLLLVFFMLAAQFGREQAVSLSGAAGGGAYSGPPRLVSVLDTGLRLNGRSVSLAALPAALEPLIESREDAIVLQPDAEANLQRLIEVTDALEAAGFGNIVLVE